jgi:DNA helicase-2/ATP-dependent DNA helicase PcrA
MFRISNVLALYHDFYKWLKREDMFKQPSNGVLEYADVFPMIYCRIRMEGMQTYDHVKHLLVDEMQDYTPVQYAVISRIFHCRKTILGDASQTVNPYSASSADIIEEVFPQGNIVKLFRSYRSTIEIAEFANRIKNNPHLIPMERHGEAPSMLQFEGEAEELGGIRKLVGDFNQSGRRSLGIICKTQRQAKQVHNALHDLKTHLLTADSVTFKEGVVVTSAHVAKGLEFDEVIVPFASSTNYRTEVDRSMLYIACTRAMHRLSLTFHGELTSFVA